MIDGLSFLLGAQASLGQRVRYFLACIVPKPERFVANQYLLWVPSHRGEWRSITTCG